MIYDCFMFYNEFDMLELRCNELKELNTVHILCEAVQTHQGKPREPLFRTQKDRFKDFNIRHIIVSFPKEEMGTWDREEYQRDNLSRGLYDAQPYDWIIVSDVDEIPRAAALVNLKEDLNVLDMGFYFYGINLRLKNNWRTAHVVRFGSIDRPLNDYKKDIGGNVIRNGGWHFSSLGGREAILDKISAYPHYEHNTKEVRENLDELIHSGQHFGNDYQRFDPVEIDETYPQFIRKNMDKFQKYIL